MFNEDLLIKQYLSIMSKKCRPPIKPMLLIAIFFILLSALGAVQAEKSKLVMSAEDVNALIPAIEAAERIPFSNLKVQSEVWVEERLSPSEPWQQTPVYVSCTAWFDGNPKGRVRVDIHKEVLKWRDGTAPYAESSYSVGFDGKHGRVVHYTRGHSGKIFSLKEGKLLPEAPEQLRTKWLASCTGQGFSFQFFFADEDKEQGRTFSRLFRAAISPEAIEAKAFEVALEEFQGVECIKFGSGDKKWGYITYWLDPNRGFALLGREYVRIREDSSKQLIRFIRVTKLEEVALGIWWPMEASIESAPSEPGQPYRRTVYRALNVVANDPNFDESVFTVPFPDGYLIDDQVAGRKYKVGE